MMNNTLDSTKLCMSLERFAQQDVILYYLISEFLSNPTYPHFQKLLQKLNTDLKYLPHLSPEQISCIQYLYRDWGYHHLKPTVTPKEKTYIFTIDNTEHSPKHFMAAIDFAKRNPKDNQSLMSFGLTLLLHSPFPPQETQPKIEAIEQLLSSTDPHTYNPDIANKHDKQKVLCLIAYNTLLTLYCLSMITTLAYPYI